MGNEIDINQTQIQQTDDYSNILIKFIDFMKLENGTVSPDTIRTYFSIVTYFIDYCKKNSIDPLHITKEQFQAYRNYLIDEHRKRSTIQTYMSVIKRFYDMLIERHITDSNEIKHVKPMIMQDDTEKIKYLTLDQLQQLFDVIKDENPLVELRDRTIIALMALGGARTVEVANLKVRDIIYEQNITTHTSVNNNVSVGITVQAKRHRRTIYLRPDVANLLMTYLTALYNKSTPDNYVFVSMSNNNRGGKLTRRAIRMIVDKYLEKINMKLTGLSAHALRHTAGTLAYASTKDLNKVQKFLGHVDPKTTSIYVHVLNRQNSNPLADLPIDIYSKNATGSANSINNINE